MKFFNGCFLVLLFFPSCKEKFSSENYAVFIANDAAMSRSATMGDIRLEARFLPVDYFVLKEFNGQLPSDSKEIEKVKANYKNTLYFKARVRYLDTLATENNEKLRALFHQLANRAQQDFVLMNFRGESATPILSTFTPLQQNEHFVDIILAFTTDEASESNFTLVYTPYFSKGKSLACQFDKQYFEKIPLLKY